MNVCKTTWKRKKANKIKMLDIYVLNHPIYIADRKCHSYSVEIRKRAKELSIFATKYSLIHPFIYCF